MWGEGGGWVGVLHGRQVRQEDDRAVKRVFIWFFFARVCVFLWCLFVLWSWGRGWAGGCTARPSSTPGGRCWKERGVFFKWLWEGRVYVYVYVCECLCACALLPALPTYRLDRSVCSATQARVTPNVPLPMPITTCIELFMFLFV